MNFFELFFKSFYYIFLKLYHVSGAKKWAEVTLFLDFEGKFILYLKWGNLVSCLNRVPIVTLNLFELHSFKSQYVF